MLVLGKESKCSSLGTTSRMILFPLFNGANKGISLILEHMNTWNEMF